MSGLAMIYRKHLTNPHGVPEATKNAVKWIKDKILHGYYMPGIEDRLLVERLFNSCLVPFSLEPDRACFVPLSLRKPALPPARARVAAFGLTSGGCPLPGAIAMPPPPVIAGAGAVMRTPCRNL